MKKLEKAIIERLEDAPVSATERFYILLVALGLRTGTWVVLKSLVWRIGDAEFRVPEYQLEYLLETLRRAGLSASIERRVTSDGLLQMEDDRERLNELVDVFVTKDQETLDRLVKAVEARDDEGIGTALGYPATAVQGFVTGHRQKLKDLPISIQLSDAGLALEMILSADHWEEELAELKMWMRVGRENSRLIFSGFEHAHSSIGYDLLEQYRRLAKDTGI